MNNLYYTYESDGELKDAECETPQEAEAWAQEQFEELHEDNPPRNGETVSAEAYIVGFCYDDDLNRIEVSREPMRLEFEAYHGDQVEHSLNYL